MTGTLGREGAVCLPRAGKPERTQHDQIRSRGVVRHGTLDIRRNSVLTSPVPVYQVRYEGLSGNSFTGSMNSDDLHELLYRKLAMGVTNEELDRDYDRLIREGHIIFPEIDLRESELAGAGLMYLPPKG